VKNEASTLASNDALLESGQAGQVGQENPTSSPPTHEDDSGNIIRVPIGEAWFEVAKDAETERWYWCLWGGHGRAMAVSAVGYKARDACLDAITQVGAAAAAKETKIAVAYLPKKRGA
jgi:uncharacterized protein YegP (UPF0339 family)